VSAMRIVAIVLIAAGIVGLIYGKFGYRKKTHEANMGSMEISIHEKRSVNVPVWAGLRAIVVGGAFLFVPHKKS